jgi:hypothetical protein
MPLSVTGWCTGGAAVMMAKQRKQRERRKKKKKENEGKIDPFPMYGSLTFYSKYSKVKKIRNDFH